MKQISVILLFVVAIVVMSCHRNSTNDSDAALELASPDDLETMVYKVGNIGEENISDTVWKMIFTMNKGIDQISISQEDSTVVVKIDKTVYTEKDILKEMETRGALQVKRVN